MLLRTICCGVVLCSISVSARAERLTVAVASNFLAARPIAAAFETEHGHEVVLVFGSTGKQYAQIRNGAPFDLFLAADARHPRLLEEQGLAVAGSRFTYAVGTLVLWSPQSGLVDSAQEVLASDAFRHLAIANPDLAPYGLAARQTLEQLGLWSALGPRLVRGESVAQAFQFVASGNAELGLVALSHVLAHRPEPGTRELWRVPASLHDPIEQQAVLLSGSAAARELAAFLAGETARGIVRAHGYTIP